MIENEDTEDIHVFMPWMLTTEEVPQYKLTYAGQQHVDDLDTYVFHVEPKQEEKDERYFGESLWATITIFRSSSCVERAGDE